MFTKLLNFRDLGGIKTADGKKLRTKRLLRAAQPVGLCENEISALREYNLIHIIDFRTSHEVTHEPVVQIEGVAYTHLDIMGENSAQAADPSFWWKLLEKNPESVAVEFKKTYEEFATSPSSIAGYSAFVKACIDSGEGAILFHCAAGKDRTGFAAAIILKLLGVSNEEIFADYLKTMEYQKIVRPVHIETAKERGFTDEQIEVMLKAFGICSSYLTAAINAAENKFGSFENYVKEGLGLGGKEIKKLQDLYLEQ